MHCAPALTALWPPLRPPLRVQDRTSSGAGVGLTFDDGPHPEGTPAVLEALAAGGHRATFFLVGEQVAGTYLLSPNKPGPASHLANAGFMVDPAVRGRGIGRQLAAHCFDRARELGYRGMVFNAVVSTNPAVRLWQSLGFAEVGRVPGAFRLPDASFADLLIMYRDL